MKLERVEFGPFSGYQSSMEAWLSPPNEIVGDPKGLSVNSSRDVVIDPITKFWERRKGCVIRNDTLSAGIEVTGLLESGMRFNARPRRGFALQSPNVRSGRPCKAILYTGGQLKDNDGDGVGFYPDDDMGWKGTLFIADPDSGLNYNLCGDFLSYYPQNTGTAYLLNATVPIGVYVVPPLWVESGDGLTTRGATQFTRRFLLAGSFDRVTSSKWTFFPSFRGTPSRHDGTFNILAASTKNEVSLLPTGPFAPLPTTVIAEGEAGAAAAADRPWKDGDSYYYSVVYQMDDGSYSLPTIPRPKGAILTSGLHLHVVGTPAGGTFYKTQVWSGIPIGPPGVQNKILCRGPLVNLTGATSPVTQNPFDLRPFAKIRNEQTSFTDTSASDTGLIADPVKVNFGLVVPRPSRYLWTGDQRVQAGYTFQSPHAFQLSCTGINSAHDGVQVAGRGNTQAYGTKCGLYRVTTTALELYTFENAAAPKLVLQATIDWATFTTVQAVVDKVNTTVVGVAPDTFEWRAQVAPGVDATAPSTGLCPTVWTAAGCTSPGGASPSFQLDTVATTFTHIPVGALAYEVRAGASRIDAGTHVARKLVPGSLLFDQMNGAAAVPAGTTVTFYSWSGDGASFGTTVDFETTGGDPTTLILGLWRTFGTANAGHVYFKVSVLPDRATTTRLENPDKVSVYHTIGSPSAAAAGQTLAPNAWHGDNHKLPNLQDPGVLVGGCDIEGASVVGYTGGVCLFQNRKGVNTGEEFDYKLWTINARRGVISWGGLVAGNGWAAYMTTQGIFAADKTFNEANISQAIFNSARRQGDLSNEIARSTSATLQDIDNSTLYMSVLGNRIAVSYVDLEGVRQVIYYDFSPGVDASGLAELVDTEQRTPYGWSSPCAYNRKNERGPFVTFEVPGSNGYDFFGCVEGNLASQAGTGADGRVDQLDVGDSDNGEFQFIGRAFMPHYLAADWGRLSVQRMAVLHKSPIGGAQILVDNGQNFGDPTTYSLSTTTATFAMGQHSTDELQITARERGPVSLLWLMWQDAAAYQGNGLWRLNCDYQAVPR